MLIRGQPRSDGSGMAAYPVILGGADTVSAGGAWMAKTMLRYVIGLPMSR